MSQPASDTAQNHLSQAVESYRDGGKQERKEEETRALLGKWLYYKEGKCGLAQRRFLQAGS